MVAEINSKSEFDELIKGDAPVIVDFYADWCGPCKAISPIFEKLSKDEAYQGVKFVKVNTDTQERVAHERNIRVMPTFLVFQKGLESKRLTGALLAPLTQLVEQAVALIPAPEGTKTNP